ncbi:hypothetical protein As57867_016675, partial [Aphanomyces stellatus]
MILVDAAPSNMDTAMFAPPTHKEVDLVSCQVCLDACAPSAVVSKICGRSCPALVCTSCLTEYIRVRTQSIPAGILAKLDCPICIRPVNLMRWKMRCPSTVVSAIETFTDHIQRACDVLCPSCHSTTDVLPKHSTTVAPIKLVPSLAKHIPALRQLCHEYCCHRATLQELWTFVNATFPKHSNQLLQHMLPLIHDVERRATLFLRLMRAQPFIKSTCCGWDLCFNCKTSDHHHGVPCTTRCAMTEDMGLCPSCNLTLVKGDGCDWITCYCGEGFDWPDSLRSFRWSLVTQRQKKLALAMVIRPFVHSFRLRKVVLPQLVAQWKLKRFKPHVVRVVAYLKAQVLKTKMRRTVLPALTAKVVLMDIAKH